MAVTSRDTCRKIMDWVLLASPVRNTSSTQDVRVQNGLLQTVRQDGSPRTLQQPHLQQGRTHLWVHPHPHRLSKQHNLSLMTKHPAPVPRHIDQRQPKSPIQSLVAVALHLIRVLIHPILTPVTPISHPNTWFLALTGLRPSLHSHRAHHTVSLSIQPL
jgi:hypothetical protein